MAVYDVLCFASDFVSSFAAVAAAGHSSHGVLRFGSLAPVAWRTSCAANIETVHEA